MAGVHPDPVLIAGGGIGGLAAALALARRGLHSVVAERRAEWSEAGAGIQLSPNGTRVLAAIGALDHLKPHAGRPREIVVRAAQTGNILQRLPLGDWIEARHGAPYLVAHRRDLQAALVAAVENEPLIRVARGFEATSFDDTGPLLRLYGRPGQTLEGRVLVGADGVFSRVRQQLFAPPAPRFSGWTAARAVLSSQLHADRDGLVPNDATGVWLARGAHIVHYPLRGGSEIAFVVVRTEAWSGRGWSEPVPPGEIETMIGEVAPRLAAAIGGVHEWRRWALFQTEPLARWSKGRATLLGDAAHPTLPFLAQGGVLALEDAVTLAHVLDRDDRAASAALADYDRARTERSQKVVAAARRNGTVFHLAGPAAMARNAAMRALGGERVMAGYDWVYGWRLEA